MLGRQNLSNLIQYLDYIFVNNKLIGLKQDHYAKYL